MHGESQERVERFTVCRDLPDGIEPDRFGGLVKYEDYQAAEARADAAEDDALARWAESQLLAAKVSGLQRAIQEVEEELEGRANGEIHPLVAQGVRSALNLLRSKLSPTERHDGDGELASERSDSSGPAPQKFDFDRNPRPVPPLGHPTQEGEEQ